MAAFPDGMTPVTARNERQFWWCRRNYARAELARARQYVRTLRATQLGGFDPECIAS